MCETMKRYISILATLLLLIAETTQSIDFTPMISMITSILPVLITVIVIMMVFKLIANLIGSFSDLGSVFRFVKTKKSVNLYRFASLSTLALMIGQTTTTTPMDLSGTLSLTTSVIYSILPIIMTVAVIGVVMKLMQSLLRNVG